MKALRRDWGHIHYRVDGPADGPALVCVNSLGTDLRMWDAVLTHLLPAGLKVIRADKRGHGLSARGPEGMTIDDLAGDVAALMDHLDLGRAVLLGCSIGGVIAQALAAAHPDRIAALILTNTAARIGTAESWAERIAQVNAAGLQTMAPAIMERWFAPAFRASDACALWQTMVARGDPAGYAACCAALAVADLTDRARTIAAPTLVVAGEEDRATPPDLVAKLAQVIPGARLEVIPGAGHLPAIEAPAEFGALISRFLKETDLG